MVSTALTDWRSIRADRLDRLFKAHAAVGGLGRGRRWETEELNHSILLRLSSEFQGFSRDLHDESVQVLANHLSAGDQSLHELLIREFMWNRKLDSGNASPARSEATSPASECGCGVESMPAIRQRVPRGIKASRCSTPLATAWRMTTPRDFMRSRRLDGRLPCRQLVDGDGSWTMSVWRWTTFVLTDSRT